MKKEIIFDILCFVIIITFLLSFVFPPEYIYPALMVEFLMLVAVLPTLRSEEPVIEREVVSELKCKKCGAVVVRKFFRGDVVFQKTRTKCPECGGEMIITAIYSVIPDIRDRERYERRKKEKMKI